ncbi:MAG: plastocyanin/azurin family copper-binding protein [Pseudomonadota bacterium]
MTKLIKPSRRSLIQGAAALTAAATVPMLGTRPALAGATQHVVEAKGVKFAPIFLYIEPGDEVSFERMPTHNVETMDGICPEGQPKIKTELGVNFVETFDVVGIVSYKCTPHWGLRMGGFIVVGKPEDPVGIIDKYIAITEEQKEYLPARGLLKKLKKDMEKRGLV